MLRHVTGMLRVSNFEKEKQRFVSAFRRVRNIAKREH
jgi:hypothetical protein